VVLLAEPLRIAKKAKLHSQLWRPDYRPSAMRWWHTTIKRKYTKNDPDDLGHFDLLLKMIAGGGSAEDAVALDYCFYRCIDDGARSSSGLWCICLKELPPSAAEARGHASSGATAEALVSIKVDLNHAADLLPISWGSTQSVFEVQGRSASYHARLNYFRRGLGVREIDTWLEPRSLETGQIQSRAMTNYLMSRTLGGVRQTCEFAYGVHLEHEEPENSYRRKPAA
jgi:hypothetical protein